MEGIGLVFAGGGGKGAYQIGVWKALIELNIVPAITGVSGTSVGALNAALFAHDNFNVAEEIYKNISHNQILTISNNDILNKISYLLSKYNTSFDLLSNASKSIFSREGLIEIISNYINLAELSNSKIRCYATCHDIFRIRSEYFELNNRQDTEISDILLASSALPIIFEPVNINGNQYYDGGISDNVPVKPLYDLGYKTIIVIHLDRGSYIDKRQFPNTSLIQIIPKDSQGNFITGTLDFSKEGAIARMRQGYENTYEIFRPLLLMNNTNSKISEVLLNIKNDNEKSELEIFEQINEINRYKKELENLFVLGGEKWKK